VFGTDPKLCDILLGGSKGENSISGQRISITFDPQRRIVLHDSSRYGTAVSYDGQGKNQERHKFTWILFDDVEKIEVYLGDNLLTLEIRLAKHETCKDEYDRWVDA